jgi:hypothetical protein
MFRADTKAFDATQQGERVVEAVECGPLRHGDRLGHPISPDRQRGARPNQGSSAEKVGR